MTKQRREGETNSPKGQRPSRASRTGSSWAEFVRLAHQAVVAFGGAGTTNRAEPRACGHSRGPRCLDSEPGTERPAGAASNASRQRLRKGAASIGWCFQPYRGKLAVRDDQRGWRKRRHDLAAICHDARKSRYIGSRWSKLGAPPLHSTSKFTSSWRRFGLHQTPKSE